MRLFIAEKPDLGRAIAEGLGGGRRGQGSIQCGDDIVTWCFGHLLTLTDPEDHDPANKRWNMDQLPMRWPIKHKPISDKKAQVALIKKLAKSASLIVHAGDPDEEGQLLVDEVLAYIRNKKPVKRLLINDNNLKIVRRALGNMRDNSEFYGMYQSALARSVSDQHYGYNLTRAYTLAGRAAGGDQVLSVGRVQTPILGLVVRRDREHESHQSHNYFDVTGGFSGEGGSFTAKYRPSESAPVDDKARLTDKSFAEQVVREVQGQPAVVTKAHTHQKQAAAPLPYNLLKLQIDANRKFGLSPDQTLKATQSLRERHQLITYNRSDCEYLSDEQHSDGAAVLAAIGQTAPVLTKAAGAANPSLKSRAFNSKNVSAHHAIIPTETVANISKLSSAEAKLYQLIARAYIAQFFPKHVYRETNVELNVCGHVFRTSARVTVKKGWKALYSRDGDNDEVHDSDHSSQDIAWIKGSSELLCDNASLEVKQTKPLPYYTMATLLKDLARVAKYVTDPRIKKLLLDKDQEKKGEYGGIGTAATRSAIIEQLLKRAYIQEQGKKVSSTALGREFHDTLPTSATVPDMTALWHEQQARIRRGEMTLDAFVDGVAEHVAREVEAVKATGITLPTGAKSSRKNTRGKPLGAKGAENQNGVPCPNCDDGQLSRRKGKKGFFWGCNQYPQCKTTFPDKHGKAAKNQKPKKTLEISSDKLCEKCGKGMVRRESKKVKGSFWWGCSGFPKCKHSESE